MLYRVICYKKGNVKLSCLVSQASTVSFFISQLNPYYDKFTITEVNLYDDKRALDEKEDLITKEWKNDLLLIFNLWQTYGHL